MADRPGAKIGFTNRTDPREAEARRVYKHIYMLITTGEPPPTQREIAASLYISKSQVQRHLDVLHAWGWIERRYGKARGISLTEYSPSPDHLA